MILPAAPLGFSEVPCGQPASYMIVPDASHHIADVNVDGVSVGVVSSYTFTNVTVTHALAASFMLDTHTITASAESGVTMTPAGVIVVNDGADQSFSFHADDCRFVEAVIVDGAGIGFTSDSSYTFTNVQADHTLSIVAGVKMFLVHALAGAGGAIAPSGTVSFPCGSSQTFTITPNTGYAIADVLVDGIPRGPVQSWTWTNFREGHSIVATFSDAAPPVVQVIAPNGGDVFGLSQPVLLRWSATDNTGIADVDLLLSRTGAFGPYEMLAAGAPNSGSYTWTATSPASADAWFQVVARDSAGHAAADTSDGAFAIAGPTSVLGIAITEFALTPVTPNPAHAFARVSFELPRASRVRIDVLEVQGRLVRSLVAGEYSAGRHSIDWVAEAGGNRLHAGVYLVRMTADRATFIRRSLWVP